ncbi:MAG TPA: class I SAM-dependent methyltransferase [Candidatus Dormibacteraeota bacterium]
MTVATATPVCVACEGPLDAVDRRFPGGRAEAGGEVHTCQQCGTAQVMPRPTTAEIAAIYSEEYFSSYIHGPGVKGGIEDLTPGLKARLAEAARRLGARGKLVDVGCAYGLLVAYARDQGWDAIGVEPSRWAAEEGRRRFGVTIHQCELTSAPIPAGSVDVVHANHVLEHLLEPAPAVRAAARLLRPGGWLVVEVPQELRRPLSDRFFGALHPELFPLRPPDPTHLEFFTPAGLRALATGAGLEMESVRTVRHQPNLASRLPLGRQFKAAVVALEEAAQTAPDLVLWARKPR